MNGDFSAMLSFFHFPLPNPSHQMRSVRPSLGHARVGTMINDRDIFLRVYMTYNVWLSRAQGHAEGPTTPYDLEAPGPQGLRPHKKRKKKRKKKPIKKEWN